MTRVEFFSFLLVLSSLYGLHTQERGPLQTLPRDGGKIRCTGDLVCEQSAMVCIPGGIETAVYPVLVPSDLKAETVKMCHNGSCSLCVQVTVEISAAFLTEYIEELGSGGCDYEDYDYDNDSESNEEDDETIENPSLNVYLRLNNTNNGSLICANLIIDPPNYSCYAMKVSLPVSAMPQIQNSSSMVVGSLVYNCIEVPPGAEMNITSYSSPRYSKILSINHEVPGCTQLDPLDKILKCEAPVLNFVNESDTASVGIVNGTNYRNISVRVFYNNNKKNTTYNNTTLMVEQRHYIPQSDIVPCMCIQAWYSDLFDAVRTGLCPFRNLSDEGMLKKSKLELKDNKFYMLNTSCDVEAEASLCWKSGSPPECRQIPHTKRNIISQKAYYIQDLKEHHPSLCVQVSVKGRVLHTECLTTSVRYQNEALLVLEKSNRNVSLCLMEDGGCKTLYNDSQQSRIEVPFLEQKLVEDVMSGQCVEVLANPKQSIYACSVDKYIRSRWTWSRVLCLLVLACILLILLLNIDDLKKWLKKVTAERSLDEIFKDRRVLVLYSPDNPAYEELVRVFALSLKELKLDVVLDQWHRTEMARVNPLPWYQKQKSDTFQKQGLILLLFSEGARARYETWTEQELVDSDPYGSFGAVLNCVYPDFKDGQTKGRYVVASFSSNNDVVPSLFRSSRMYLLPSQLLKLIQELAGDNMKILGKNQAKRLSAKIRNKLQEFLKVCQSNENKQTVIAQSGTGLSQSSAFSENVAVELEPLVSNVK